MLAETLLEYDTYILQMDSHLQFEYAIRIKSRFDVPRKPHQ